MSWKPKMGKATFRGVPFHIETLERSGGRRTVRHEYPGKDEPFAEDLGRKGRTFPVEGYVIGDEYLAAKEALITALEKGGPGELVHPGYVGTRRVMVETYRVRESRDEGGIARFSIDFFETPAQPAQPESIVDAAAKVTESAEIAKESINAEFLAAYSPNQHLDSLSDQLRSVTLAINNAVARVQMSTQAAATFRRRVDEFEDSISSLLNTPETLVSNLGDIFDGIGSGSALLEVYSFDPGLTPSGVTPSRQQETTNFDALYLLLQRLALINAALLAPNDTYDSYDDAVDARNAINDLLDEQSETVSDDVYPDLLQLRADLVKAVPGEDSELGRLVTYTPPVSVASLVLAHNLYGNLDFEADLIARNKVSHPGFVPGSRALEVLSDDS